MEVSTYEVEAMGQEPTTSQVLAQVEAVAGVLATVRADIPDRRSRQSDSGLRVVPAVEGSMAPAAAVEQVGQDSRTTA